MKKSALRITPAPGAVALHRHRFASVAAAGLLTVLSLGLSSCAPASDAQGAQPATSQLSAPAQSGTSDGPAAAVKPQQAMQSASMPVSISAPTIGLSAKITDLGKEANGELQVPTGEPGSPAGWYRDSPAPGQPGSSIILGHVNSTTGPVGLFYRLHEMQPGQQFATGMADGTTKTFTIDKVDIYHKSSFPTIEVYRNADRPEVRLITCGGYDKASNQYLDNTVVYAHLTSG
ncbi:MAG: class F sortase [Pseudarthrobacter sp.]